MDATSLAVVVIAAVVGPIILSWLNNRQLIAREKRDRKRQDEVAAEALRQQAEVAEKAEEAAQLLVDAQHATTAQTIEVAAALAKSDAETAAQLQEIKGVTDATHVLVNSNMDNEKRARLRSMEQGFVSLLEIAELRSDAGKEPRKETTEGIAAARTDILELKRELTERAKRLEIADAKDAPSSP